MSTLELDRPTDLSGPGPESVGGAESYRGALAPGAEPLTRRELIVLRHLADDHLTLREIASTLFVTRNTIKSQVQSIYRKLGVNTRDDAVSWARSVGLS